MTTVKVSSLDKLVLAPGDKIAIVAGSGRLPIDLAEHLTGQGISPFIVMLGGEADACLAQFEHTVLELESVATFIPLLKRHRVSHVVFGGEVSRRPRLRSMKLNLPLLALLPRVIMALTKGDDGLLRVLVDGVEAAGIRVVGAHQIMPDLLAPEGTLTAALPVKKDWADIKAARQAALAIGALDIGQAAIAIGGRAVALEGIEGTEGLLERVKTLRTHGRIAGKKRGVLAKCCKPAQEERIDLPAIGPDTIRGAHAAGLAGVAVDAGRSLIIDCSTVIGEANRLGLFVVGLPPDKTS